MFGRALERVFVWLVACLALGLPTALAVVWLDARGELLLAPLVPAAPLALAHLRRLAVRMGAAAGLGLGVIAGGAFAGSVGEGLAAGLGTTVMTLPAACVMAGLFALAVWGAGREPRTAAAPPAGPAAAAQAAGAAPLIAALTAAGRATGLERTDAAAFALALVLLLALAAERRLSAALGRARAAWQKRLTPSNYR